jgi:pimeloyl-ACP methyl ester carboxylesterase
MATFGLVHGMCVGAWSWELVTPHLADAGHEVIAVDLPSEDSDATFSDYAAVVREALTGADDDIVLVGHSLGGLTVPLVAARRPVREVVFVCGVIPVPGKSVVDQGFDFLATDPAKWQVDNGDGSISIRPEAVGPYIAQDMAPALIVDIASRLRPQFLTPLAEQCPLESLPKLPYRYVLCREDRFVSPDWSRRAAPERLGVEPIELAGSHMATNSRPEELAAILLAGRD